MANTISFFSLLLANALNFYFPFAQILGFQPAFILMKKYLRMEGLINIGNLVESSNVNKTSAIFHLDVNHSIKEPWQNFTAVEIF